MYNEIYEQLDSYLSTLQDYWQFEAFHFADYPWTQKNPALSHFLDDLSDEALHLYQCHPEKLQVQLTDFINPLHSLNDPLFSVKALSSVELNIPFWLKTGIKGRKWSQISVFAQQVNTQHPIIEWCAGKGHLGRLISWQKNGQ